MPSYTANGTISEDDEEHVLVDFCDLHGWKHTHFSNETYTTSWKQKAKMKYLGVHRGIPDHLVLVPSAIDDVLVPVYIEMKREKGGTISDNQFEWISALKKAGQYVTVCEGGNEAIKFIDAVRYGNKKVLQAFDERFEKKFEKRQRTIEKRSKKPVEF